MVMVYILVEYMPEGALAKEDHPGLRFVFDRADPALGIGIQIGDRGGNGTRVTPASSMIC
jgi:hypothetical protein